MENHAEIDDTSVNITINSHREISEIGQILA